MSVCLEWDSIAASSGLFRLIDVRPGKAFFQGHLPHALSFPLSVRPETTLSLLQDMKHPVWRGWRAAAAAWTAEIKAAARTGVVYCHSGTWRSEFARQVLGRLGLETKILGGGYRAVQAWQEILFRRSWNLLVLGGETGSGKTDLLERLARCGEQTLPLQALAGHDGSVFGKRPGLPQPTSEQFQNDLAECLQRFEPARRTWVEDCPPALGRAGIPAEFYRQMQTSPMLCLQTPWVDRVNRTVGKFKDWTDSELEAVLPRLASRLGPARTQAVRRVLAGGGRDAAARILLEYYDTCYYHQWKSRKIVGTIRHPSGPVDAWADWLPAAIPSPPPRA